MSGGVLSAPKMASVQPTQRRWEFVRHWLRSKATPMPNTNRVAAMASSSFMGRVAFFMVCLVVDFTQRDPEAEGDFAEAHQPRGFAMFPENLRGFA